MTMTMQNIRRANIGGPLRLFAYSVEGWGKTTLANEFPDAVWIAAEDGFPKDLATTPNVIGDVTTWSDVMDAVEMLIAEKHDFKTLVFDTLDWIEPLCHQFICQRDSGRKTEMNKGGHKLESIEDYGYGKGYVVAGEEFRRLIARLVELREKRGMHVIVLAHAQVKKFSNPEGEDYDRWEAKVHGKVARLFVEWSDAFLFGFYEVAAGKIEDEKKAKGVSTGRRMFGCGHNATYDAKNRLGMPARVEVKRDEVRDLVDRMVTASLRGEDPRDATPEQKSDARAAREVAGRELARNAEEVARGYEQGEDRFPQRDPGGTYAAKTAEREPERAHGGEARDERRREPRPSPQQEERREPPKGRSPSKEQFPPAPEYDSPAARMRALIGEKIDSPLVPSQYAKKVQGWVQMAGDDMKKLEAILQDIIKTLSSK